MTSKQRLQATLNHTQPDRVCVDFGGTPVSGVSAMVVDRLRRELLGEPDYHVKVIEPYQMLGEIDPALREAMGVDVVQVTTPTTMFGFANTNWKPFTLFDGTKVRVPGQFNVTEEENGDWLMYPGGDTSLPASGRMPKGGLYFDAICRQEPIDEDRLDPSDNMVEFVELDDAGVASYRQQQTQLGDCGAVAMLPGAGFGDIATVPATQLARTPGIRNIEEWYVSVLARPDYVRRVFERQCEIALANIARLIDALGDSVQVGFVSGTDFGTQRGLFISRETYRSLYMPFHKEVNDLIHERSNWKTFIHSCGSVRELIPDFIDAGWDILNPVQCSAEGMAPRELKKEFGNDIVFWGGGVDTQKTLPFGTPEEVYREVRERIEIFNDGGGFVFNTIHNVQANSPVENMLAMLKAIRDSDAGCSDRL